MNTNENAALVAVPPPAPGSAPSVCFQLEGQRKQDACRWDGIGLPHEDEAAARDEEKTYREYMANEKTGWLDFRVIRVTTTREVLPNNLMMDTPPPANQFHE